jgi:prepilin-type N-terminal cleavage/methylation domain-containing protein
MALRHHNDLASGHSLPQNIHLAAGFTLLEMAIVLTVIALIMGGGLSLYSERLLSERAKITEERLNRVELALKQYVRNFGTLPCPAVANKGVDDATGTVFGRQVCNPASHALSASVAGNRTDGAARHVLIGTVPVRVLGLPDYYAFDGWNNRFKYAVDNEYSYGPTDPPTITSAQWGPRNGAIQVNDINNNERTNCGGDCAGFAGGIYVLYSMGQNGFGSWRDKTDGGARQRRPMLGMMGGELEQVNAHTTLPVDLSNITQQGALQSATTTFRDATIQLTDRRETYFDDIVRWKTRLQF